MSNRDELHILDPHDYRGHEGKVVITSAGRIVHDEAGEHLLWDHRVIERLGADTSRLHFLGFYNGHQVFSLEVAEPESAALSPARSGLRDFLGGLPEGLFRLLGRALQINEWHSAHRHCGYCGGPTERVANERAMGCPTCSKIFYPRLSPCIMALVTRGEECLLARNSAWTTPRFSVLAGFIEPGESAEDAIHREVMEEVGVEVANLTYIDSQPWPFPGQLMLGFFADHAAGDIRVDGVEIAEAHWYHYRALPQIPDEHALSGQLIRRFVERCRRAV